MVGVQLPVPVRALGDPGHHPSLAFQVRVAVAGEGAQNDKTRLPTASSPPPCAHHDPCPGTLYRYTLLLYGTAEDMTARPTGSQVTSSACVQRDTEGLCQGEWPARHGPLAGRWQCACVARGGQVGGRGW